VAKEKPAVPEKRQPVEVAKIEEVQLPVKEYKGKKISLDLRDADIQTVFRMISQVSNRNIITSPDIQDKITIRLINVPWDQVLDIILAHKNWVKIEEGNVLRITTPENLPRGRQGQQK
jgi:type IV pilus assembly protein PilQ